MKNYQYIFFDLDGTLTDPGEGITNSVAYALKKYGINIEDKKALYPFIGPPLIESFEKYYGFTHTQSREAVDFYREYYAVKGIFENSVYEGIEELLKALTLAGKKIVLATSKPEKFAEQILEHFGLRKYFYFVAGANMDETRSTKAEVLEYALESVSIKDLKTAVMIGDRCFDMSAAKQVGIDRIGVLYGYGDKEELENAHAQHIAETPQRLYEMLIAK